VVSIRASSLGPLDHPDDLGPLDHGSRLVE